MHNLTHKVFCFKEKGHKLFKSNLVVPHSQTEKSLKILVQIFLIFSSISNEK